MPEPPVERPADAVPLEPVPLEPVPTEPPPAAPLSDPSLLEPAEPAPSDPEEVVVLGARGDRVAGSLHVIGQRQLLRFRHDDPNSIALLAPGVTIRQEDGVGLRPNIGIRGVNADRSKKLTLMEDGVLFGPAPYSAPAAYYFPLMARMVQVRVVKGPSAIAHGPQTVGGAIDFITRPIPSQPRGVLDIGVGEYGYNKVHAHFGASTEQFGVLVEGVRLNNSGFKVLPDGADTGSTRSDWMVKAAYEPFPQALVRNRFELKLSYADEVSNETYLGLSEADFRADPNRRYPASALDQMNSQRNGLVLSHELDAAGTGLRVKSDVYRFNYTRAWRKLNGFRGSGLSGVLRDPADPINAEYYAVLTGAADGTTAADTLMIGPNDRSYVSQGLQSKLELELNTKAVSHAIEVGVRLHNDHIERRHSESGFVMTGGVLLPDGSAETITSLQSAEAYAIALHASDAITWRSLTITPGVRAELIWTSVDDPLAATSTHASVQALMPGLGAYYGLTEQLGVLAGVYRGFSPPAPGSDAHVRPEYSVNYEAGARFSSYPLRADLVGFYNDYSNLTDVCTLASGCLSENLDRQLDAGEARIYGIEASVTHEVPVGPVRLPLLASYTFTQTEFLSSFASADPIYGTVQEGDEVPYVPRHQLTASLGVETDRAGFVASLAYISAMREQPGSAALDQVLSTDEQFWVDLGASFSVIEALTLWVNARNVLDNQVLVSRRPYGARPNAPRWVQAGARLEY